MTAIAIPSARGSTGPAGIAAELFRRQPKLTLFGFLLLALTIPVLAAQGIDPRTLNGVNVWVKPAKFLVSIGTYALTFAWFYGYAEGEWRPSRMASLVVWTIILAGSFEIGWIGFQAARGEMSHFNDSTRFHAIMYALMGIGALLLVASALPLAWAIARRPAPGLGGEFRAALVAGLVLTFVLGGGLGFYMSGQGSHAVGPEASGLPLFGWNGLGGDLRVAHFFGIHAMQALPLAAALLGRASPTIRWTGTTLFGVAWTAATLLVFFQAVGGRPFLPL